MSEKSQKDSNSVVASNVTCRHDKERKGFHHSYYLVNISEISYQDSMTPELWAQSTC